MYIMRIIMNPSRWGAIISEENDFLLGRGLNINMWISWVCYVVYDLLLKDWDKVQSTCVDVPIFLQLACAFISFLQMKRDIWIVLVEIDFVQKCSEQINTGKLY